MTLDWRCSRGHEVDRYVHPPIPGPYERLNLYIHKGGKRACLKCTRSQWRAQWRRKKTNEVNR